MTHTLGAAGALVLAALLHASLQSIGLMSSVSAFPAEVGTAAMDPGTPASDAMDELAAWPGGSGR